MFKFPTKIFLFLFLFLGGSLLYSQSFNKQIIWFKAESGKNAIPDFKGSVNDLSQTDVPLYANKVEVGGNYNASLEFSDFQYEKLPSQYYSYFKNLNIEEEPVVDYGYGSSEEGSYMFYSFFPFVKRDGQYMKVTAYNVSVNLLESKNAAKSVSSPFKANSVLSNGDWYKFSAEKDGIYKITPADLSNAGIDINGLSIDNIRVFGNGDGILPTLTHAPRKDDLNEIAYEVRDFNSNGIFEGNDFILFFARDPHTWKLNPNNNRFTHQLNYYRDKNYYFITVNNGTGKNVPTGPTVTATPNHVVSSFDDYDFKNDDIENLVGTGKRWVGDVFDFDLENNYGFSFPNLDKSAPVRVKIAALARASSSNTFMELTYQGTSLLTLPFRAYSSVQGANFVEEAVKETSFNSLSDNFTFNLRYDNSGNPSGVAWLDYIEVQVRRNLTFSGKSVIFRDANSIGNGNISEFVLTNVNPNVKVWDVTDVNSMINIPVNYSGQQLSFVVETDSLREFIAFTGSDFPALKFEQKVENQNLHAMEPASMYIIAHPKFLPAAERLANFHKENDHVSVKIVTIDQVYNEFSSGGLDITAIRDFMRMLYQKNTGGPDDLKYLLLYGDGSYDYRDRISNNNNYIPLWQNDVAFSLYSSTVSDDYYGFLDAGEGNNLSKAQLDLGIGRIPCESLGQAQAYVDKVVNYITGENRFGDWRNKILFMTDDADEGSEIAFVRTSENLEDTINKTSNSFIVEKIYTDAYKQVSSSGSQSYPEASKDMFRKVQQGNLVTNYIGHGGEIGLSSEKLMQLSDINRWTNFDALPLFMTITCEFTRFDDPKRVSAGEQLIMNPNGGAIALISTTRVVYVAPAVALNEEIFSTLLSRPNNKPRALGDILKDAKNKLEDSNRLKFSLFGDPSITLAIPYYNVQTNEINGKPISSGNLDTLKALSKVEIKGQVNDLNHNKIDGFDGVLNVTVLDKPSERKTLRNDNAGPALPFKLQNNVIYKGKVEVVDGEFTVEFLVPQDIAYQYGHGKISYYAENGSVDAAGVFDTIMVGGFNESAEEDAVGPEVMLYMNDESFVRGGVTGSNPELYAVLADSSGINTVGNGVGHDLVAVLDNNAEQSFVINEYYEADLNSYKTGKVRYPLYELEAGPHTIKLKVFDVYNNFTQVETEFVVADDEEMALAHVLNYPNPFTTYTEFHFEHNRANQPLDVQVQIFTVSGKLVKTINTSVVPTGNRITGISWNGLDDYGDKIGKGVYVYRLKVRSQLDNTQAEKYEKLVILR